MGHNFFVFDYKFFKYWWHFAKKNFLHHAWSLCLNTPCQDIVRVLVIACESFLYCVGNITFENLNGKKVKKKKDKRIRVVKDADQRHEIKKLPLWLQHGQIV